MKCEQVYWTKYLTRDEARLDIVGYLMYYNSDRMHSYCGNTSPNAFEAALVVRNNAVHCERSLALPNA